MDTVMNLAQLAAGDDPQTVESNFDTAAYNFWARFGVAMCMFLSNAGCAYGTMKSGIGIASLSVTRPQMAFKAIIPVVMAGILSIYGLIISLICTTNIKTSYDNQYTCWMYLGAGLTTGLSNLASGYTIGIVGEQGTVMYGVNDKIYLGLILVLIFAEVLGLYGMIGGILIALSGGS